MASIDTHEAIAGQDVQALIADDFRLESGQRLTATQVVGRLHGASGPLVVVAGGISSDRFATRWWPWAVKAGGPIDLDRVRVLAFDLLPGRENPGVTITTTDQARLLAFARDCGREAEGLALARQLAMTTYRTAEEFALRFGPTAPAEAGQPYPVCDYLIARGEAYAGATSADRWISLSDSLDRHRVDPRGVRCPITVIGVSSDTLVPIEDSRELARLAPNLRRLVEVRSVFGHDAFLKEREQIGRLLHHITSPLNLQSQEIAA